MPSVLKKAKDNGIKVYFWHHELEIPDGFIEHYPEILNETGDIEASSPVLEDFLRNKIRDFFELFPDFAGLVMTLHETVVPLLKLPNQKLSKKERIKHVCGIILEECKNFGKEVIFRPFASLPEDCKAMSEAFNLLGEDLEIMTKWTQFDWNLHLPWNESSRDLSNHPLWLEGDINGEYFGQGRIPCILKKQIKDRISRFANEPCTIKGFVLRTDRNLNSLYNGINEVNILIGAYGWLEYDLHNPDSNAQKLEITFYTGGHAAKAEIFFRGSATQTVIYENPTPQLFDQFIIPLLEKAPEKIQIRIAKLSKEPLGISVIKLC